jgi:ssDNA thymidine ADP-ribosyltransferase, DarT
MIGESDMATLGPEAAHIFRITHVRNVPWILDHGLHCQTSKLDDPNFVPIGMQDLIDKRSGHPVGNWGITFHFTSRPGRS